MVHIGDALAWLQLLPSRSADALITDPPYSSGGAFRADRAQSTGTKYGRGGSGGKNGGAVRDAPDFTGDSRDQRSFAFWMTLWLTEAHRVVKPGGPVCLCLFTDWRQLPLMTDVLQAGGWTWRGIAVWDKKNGRPRAGRFRQDTEFVVWGSHGAMPVDYAAPVLPGVFRASPPRGADRHHQTSKPIEVMREVVRICPAGGLIIDPFTGGGATGVAAVMEGRRFAGSEMLPVYAEIARARIASAVS